MSGLLAYASLVVLVALSAVSLASQGVGSQRPRMDGMTPRPVFSDETAYMADVSADGRLAIVVTQPFGRGTNEDPSRLEIRNLLTKATTVLAGGPSPAGSPGRPAAVFSADAKYVAYTWLDARLTDTGMLQVIATTDGATPRTLIPADPSDRGNIPHGWSPDGKSILVLIHGPSNRLMNDPTSIAWVSVADGAVRTIKVLEPWRGGASAWPRLSRDGKLIAYSATPREGSRDRYIYVMDANGRNQRVVAAMAGVNTSPVWMPDGARVVFVNGQADRRELFAVSVQEGGASGEPRRLQTDFAGEPIGISPPGALVYRRQSGGGLTEVIAERGPAGVRVVQSFSGYGGVWSSGNMLAYIRRDRELVIRSVDADDERIYAHSVIPTFPPHILRDGSAAILYIPPDGDGGRSGGSFYLVDLQSGNFKRRFAKNTAEHARSNVAVLSPDDKTLYIAVLADAPARWSAIVGVDLATGIERPVLTLPGPGLSGTPGMAISPDGITLAFHAVDGRIITVGIDGSDYRELLGPSPGGGWRDVMKWTPDGKSIVFVTRPSEASSSWRLMRISSAGGQPEFDGLESSMLPRLWPVTNIDLSPDASRVALSARSSATYDVWALDNVMSDAAKDR